MAEEAAHQSLMAPENGSFCWTEIASNQAKKCKEFYKEVFGWQFKESKPTDGLEYMEFTTGGSEPVGGLFDMKPEWYGGTPPPPNFTVYVAVDDIDANAKKAEELGGKIVSPPQAIPGVGRFCVIEDPTGAKFATYSVKS